MPEIEGTFFGLVSQPEIESKKKQARLDVRDWIGENLIPVYLEIEKMHLVDLCPGHIRSLNNRQGKAMTRLGFDNFFMMINFFLKYSEMVEKFARSLFGHHNFCFVPASTRLFFCSKVNNMDVRTDNSW